MQVFRCKAKLLPLDGGKPISITRDVTLVGRERGLCDLILGQTCDSKLQCLIAKTDGLLFIRDLGSTNGTKVNGQPRWRAAASATSWPLPAEVLCAPGARVLGRR